MEKRIDKATERALEAYPKATRDIDGIVVDIGHPQYIRDLYIEGYHQAEKDLQLTYDDICEIMEIREDVLEMDSYENLYEEILKRFKEMKEK